MATETKTTSSSTSTSTPPNPGANPFQSPFGAGSFDPMAMWQQGQQAFAKMMTDSLGRWQAFADQCASIETQVSSHAQQAVTQWAQLAKEAIAYGTQLSAEARKLGAAALEKMGA